MFSDFNRIHVFDNNVTSREKLDFAVGDTKSS